MSIYFAFINNFYYLLPIITFVGLIIGLYYFKKLNSGFRTLTFLLIYSFINDILSYASAKFFGSNLIFLNTYAIAELILIYIFLKTYKKPNSKYFNFIFSLLILFNIYEIVNIDYTNFDIFQAYSRSINSIFLLVTSLAIIVEKLKQDQFEPSNKILYALLSYLVITSLLFLPLNILINFKDIRVYVVWVVNVLNVSVFFSIIIYQIWKFGRLQKV